MHWQDKNFTHVQLKFYYQVLQCSYNTVKCPENILIPYFEPPWVSSNFVVFIDDPCEESQSNPEVLILQQAIQDMDMQIEEQKIKIENTPNRILRVNYVSFSIDTVALFHVLFFY